MKKIVPYIGLAVHKESFAVPFLPLPSLRAWRANSCSPGPHFAIFGVEKNCHQENSFAPDLSWRLSLVGLVWLLLCESNLESASRWPSERQSDAVFEGIDLKSATSQILLRNFRRGYEPGFVCS
jgi:hypothetical protein